MLDHHILRYDLHAAVAALKSRGYSLDAAAYEALEARRKKLQMKVEELQSLRNSSAKSIGQAKASGADIQPLLAAVAKLGDDLKTVEGEFREVRDEQEAWLLDIPNLAAADVPVGADQGDILCHSKGDWYAGRPIINAYFVAANTRQNDCPGFGKGIGSVAPDNPARC